MKILVADDDEAVRDYVIRALEGHDVVTAWNGAAAAAHFRRYGADIVFLDIEMPVMRGDEACREIREVSIDVPIYCISGLDLKKEELLEKGFTGGLCKPFGPGDLRALVEAVDRLDQEK